MSESLSFYNMRNLSCYFELLHMRKRQPRSPLLSLLQMTLQRVFRPCGSSENGHVTCGKFYREVICYTSSKVSTAEKEPLIVTSGRGLSPPTCPGIEVTVSTSDTILKKKMSHLPDGSRPSERRNGKKGLSVRRQDLVSTRDKFRFI